ncbi:MAG TPA: carboxypeptidase-like regulatory domain-containing protein, partial [Vicinamibacterales bacterium]|nr:carboxypeptidase-like regulatory domain-containing protein [Vicinamibacterales bacterium]
MRSRLLLVVPVVCGLIALRAASLDRPLHAQQRPDEVALTGIVTAADEGPLEGVLVSAKKTGSTITVTVVSDQSGRYRFPRARLGAGQYALRIKAT